MADLVAFWVIAPISVLSGAAMVLARNAVHAALFLIVNFFTLAVFFLMLGSPFLFVLMLLGVARQVPITERIKGQRVFAILLGLGLVAEVVLAVRLGVGFSRGQLPDFNRASTVQGLAEVLFNSYFFPFEVTSILLIVAAIGAMLHGRRRVTEEETIDFEAEAEEQARAEAGAPR